jgi:uncharacterized protein YndB with AHSA1/START domain
MTTAEGLVVRKTVTVQPSPERAFALFTEHIGEWWPFGSHSIHGDKVDRLVFERRVGGRVYERTADGEEADWATVLAFEPPSRFLLEWRVNPSRAATELEVTFTPNGSGTRVDLEHRGWDAEERHRSYDSGWDVVLGEYVAAADV